MLTSSSSLPHRSRTIATPNMGRFHNNELQEVPLFDDFKPARPGTPQISRTGTEDPVMQEEISEKKRKYDEAIRFQELHSQPAVDTVRATDMDNIHFKDSLENFNYTLYDADNRGPIFNHTTAFHPWMQGAHSSSFFYSDGMPDSSELAQSFSGDTLVPGSFVPGSYTAAGPTYPGAEPSYSGNADAFAPESFAAEAEDNEATDGRHENFKEEDARDKFTVSAPSAEESDFAASESEEERPRKTPKINKDGAPRKPRQPRPKLLKWNDDDWKNVCLGIVWACGETGVQIPFEQAAQVVGEKCTAGALQQALLKLRGRQIDAGHQIPNLKMAWTRKNKHASPSPRAKASQEPEANKPRKKPTRVEGTQSFLVTLPRAYNEQDRQGMASPYKWKKPPRKVRSNTLRSSANIQEERSAERSTSSSTFDFGAYPYNYDYLPGTPTASQGTNYLPATPMTGGGRFYYNSPPATPFGQNIGYLQGMSMGEDDFTRLLTTEGLHDLGNGFADANDDVFTS